MASSDLHPLTQATAGAVGSVISNSLVYPIDTVTTRLQTARRPSKGKASPYASLTSAIKTILREEGAGAFYSGVLPDSLSTALSNFIYFFAYTSLRDALLKKRAASSPSTKGKGSGAPLLSAVEELLVGCFSGVIAKAVVSPLSNIVVRQQTATAAREKVVGGEPNEKGKLETKGNDSDSDDDDGPYGRAPSAMEIARDIYDEKGWTGFWSGFKSSIILTTNPAITFYAMALLKRLLVPKKHLEHPTPLQTFLTGAIASSIASAITYPLILAKTRLQFKSPSGRRMYRSTFDVFNKTIKKHGIVGLYAGLSGQLAKGFLSEGVKMTIKERAEKIIMLLYQQAKARTIRN